MLKKKLYCGIGIGIIIFGMANYGFGTTTIPDSIIEPINSNIFQATNEDATVISVFQEDLPVVKKIIEQDKSIIDTQNIKNSKTTTSTNSPDSIGNGYKVHLIFANFIEQYDSGKSFGDIIQKDYLWEVPLLDVNGNVISANTAWKDNGKWDIAKTGLDIPTEYVELSSKPDKIGRLLIDNGIKDVNKISHVRFLTKKTDAIYIETKDGAEYLIPMSFRSDLTGLENLKLYGVQEAIDILRNK